MSNYKNLIIGLIIGIVISSTINLIREKSKSDYIKEYLQRSQVVDYASASLNKKEQELNNVIKELEKENKRLKDSISFVELRKEKLKENYEREKIEVNKINSEDSIYIYIRNKITILTR